MNKFILTFIALCGIATSVLGQSVTDSITYKVEMQSAYSNDKTPLWLNANRHGASSLESSNGYLRTAAIRNLSYDKSRKFDLGYGLDVIAPYNYTSNFVLQQAFIEGRWLNGVLSVGSKEYPMELKNNRLSSGSQTLGINARPVPQVRLALPEYYTMPFLNRWLHIKGHIAFGKTTDDNWQEDFTDKKTKYTSGTLYHSKAGYIKIGKEKAPFSLELGLEMASIFGGDAYRPNSDGSMQKISSGRGLKAFWNALIPGGADSNERTYKNAEGDQLGSWVIRANYQNDDIELGVYWDHFFEDHSGMFFLDYNGYGNGDEWDKKKDHKFLLYDMKDMMLGAELKIKHKAFIQGVVFEYIYTKYQSGAMFHDHTQWIPDHIGGMDEYYNHSMFTGWQHWGQVIGNPLFRSPIYNEDGTINVDNNRFYAFHLGIDGKPSDVVSWRLLCTVQKGFGTYHKPYTDPHTSFSMMAETEITPQSRSLKGWNLKLAYGMDTGKIYGHNYGGMITLSKSGLLKL